MSTNTMTDAELDVLYDVAQSAPEGTWVWRKMGGGLMLTTLAGGAKVVLCALGSMLHTRDDESGALRLLEDCEPTATHIAAFDPPTVKSLMGEIRQLRKDRAQMRAGIEEVIAEGDGYWDTCSGCAEGVDGYLDPSLWPYSDVFKCQIGGGCGDCGGIGAVWHQSMTDDQYRAFCQPLRGPDVEGRSRPAEGAGMSDGKAEWSSFWCSFYADVPLPRFEYWGPWWVSGEDPDGVSIVVAAVRAANEQTAMETLRNAYDADVRPPDLRERFCEFKDERDIPGFPFHSDRFRRADWMKWPFPPALAQEGE